MSICETVGCVFVCLSPFGTDNIHRYVLIKSITFITQFVLERLLMSMKTRSFSKQANLPEKKNVRQINRKKVNSKSEPTELVSAVLHSIENKGGSTLEVIRNHHDMRDAIKTVKRV